MPDTPFHVSLLTNGKGLHSELCSGTRKEPVWRNAVNCLGSVHHSLMTRTAIGLSRSAMFAASVLGKMVAIPCSR